MSGSVVDKLCAALIELLEKKSLEDITVKELIAKAKISRSSYNYHFYAMEDVLDEIFRRIEHDIWVKICDKPFEPGDHQHHFVIKYIFKALELHKDEVRVLIQSGYRDRLYNMIVSKCIELGHRHKVAYIDESGKIRTLQNGPTLDLYVAEFCYAMIPRIDYYLSYDFEISPAEACKFFKQVNDTRRRINDYANIYLINNWQKFNY